VDHPAFDVTPERLRAYADMFEIKVSDEEIARLAAQLPGGLAGLAALRDVDVDGIEPFTAFPIDRVRS
jgi:hypothetical protein